MANRKCLCGIYTLDPQDASLVLNSIPACNMACLRRAEARDPRASRDVPVGERWYFYEHRNMEEVIRIEETDDGFRIAS
ncbi:MAG TPA: hypothetical protein VHY35_06250 [Stellaceae bacterium]|jgi:hypothetical protein|nr:hypothetical protein [Stellaceae bacterium]